MDNVTLVKGVLHIDMPVAAHVEKSGGTINKNTGKITPTRYTIVLARIGNYGRGEDTGLEYEHTPIFLGLNAYLPSSATPSDGTPMPTVADILGKGKKAVEIAAAAPAPMDALAAAVATLDADGMNAFNAKLVAARAANKAKK